MSAAVVRNRHSRLMVAPANALGTIRAGVHGVFLIAVLTTHLDEIGYLPVTILRPLGVLSLLSWKFYDRIVTPQGMKALKILLILSLFMSTVGYLTSWTTKASAILVIFYQGLLRSFGHLNHDEMTGIYLLIILAFTPCGDAFSLDALYSSRPPRRSIKYGYPILLMQLVFAWCYFTAGLSKLRISGLAYFGNDNLAIQAIDHSLDNLHNTQFRLAFSLPQFRDYLGLLVAVTVIWEILFPIAVFSRRARWWFLGLGVIFHLVTLFIMNIFFANLLAMYLIFVNWPLLLAYLSRKTFCRSLVLWWRNFRRVPEEFPGTRMQTPIEYELLIWDGDCGFCAAMISFLKRIARRPFQDRPFESLRDNVPPEILRWKDKQMFWVYDDQTFVGGSRALTAALAATGYGLISVVLESKPFRSFTWVGYRLVARNRAMLSRYLSKGKFCHRMEG
jgi:hypothetical protein